MLTGLFLIMYIFIFFTAVHFSKIHILYFDNVSIPGVFTAINFIILLAILIIDYNKGGKLAIVMAGMSFVTMFFIMVMGCALSLLPSIIFYIDEEIAIVVIRREFLKERKISYTDALTGISNRRAMSEYIKSLISKRTPFYLLYIDLDHFKHVNDTEGHEKGDEILKLITKKWLKICTRDCRLGRLGGDEFLCVVKANYIKDIDEFANKLIEIFGEYDEKEKHLHYVTASIGISEYPKDGIDENELLKKADISMYNAKNNGRGRYCKHNV